MRTVGHIINPLTVKYEQLVSLASGFARDDTVADRLLESEKYVEKQFVEFSRENLLTVLLNLFLCVNMQINQEQSNVATEA